MSSIVEVESWRVAEILGTAAAQLELLALVPKGKRLATVASAGAERAATTSSHSRRGPKGSTTDAAGPSAAVDAELADALAALSAAEAGAERHRKEALGEETKESVAARAWASACCKRVARAMSAAAAVAGPEGRSSALLAQLRQKLEQRRAPHVDVTDVGEGKDEDDGDDDGSGAEGRGQEEQLFPLESMARVVGALRLAMHARMRTNAEQEAIRQEFERTVSARIREGHAREDLLLEEHRRMEMRHKDEEDRLTEMQSKLVLELRDLSEAEARRRAALESDIEQRETAIRAGAEDRTHRLVDSLSAAKAALTEAEERDLTEEARLRKVRNYQVRDLAERLGTYDKTMRELRDKEKALTDDNEALEEHCASLEAHFALLDRNRSIAQEQVMQLQAKREKAAQDYMDKYSGPVARIARWHQRLKAKWEADRKAKKGGAKKKGR
ncbi:hypothetical protein FNF29_00860 [Cafeteria roenbergensis]|uniref:Dynein regulatory complex protein 10 n=1 Tax=Cafeteria roenbergensis TaxID=33653 RepID=A0A5A8CVM8_CAFRO|nr:hypothetical protein FNF29_00860 [Cafeteria roenbergensis]KAA0164302.1 hypothetical protein FNF28_03933 [Cafeteria roenbergensis]|eukprot:KAA0156749.1 hypothetical protein FNF29_00860 [Cafeteria roenbergensis]